MKKWPAAAAAGGALAGVTGWALYNGQTPKAQGFGTTFIGTPGEGNLMALTYDDGPNTAWTPQLMEVLEKHGVKATFFTIGKYAEQQPELLREVAAAGHAIGNHTYNHVTMAAAHRRHDPRASCARPPRRSRPRASRWPPPRASG